MTPLYRVPPFPHAGHRLLMRPGSAGSDLSDKQVDELMEATAAARVGGDYWADQPPLPDPPYTLVRVRDAAFRAKLQRSIDTDRKLLVWRHSHDRPSQSSPPRGTVAGDCDPWHLVSRAERLFVDADDELALIASLSGVPVRCVGEGPFQSLDHVESNRSILRETFRAQVLDPFDFVDPFNEGPATPDRAIELCTFWRGLIDSNRDIVGALGFASWKRSTVEPLLWAGSRPVPFEFRPRQTSEGERLAIWRSRVAPDKLAELDRSGFSCAEVEDGFIRSVGLGADCIPPLSIVVDRRGIYFDPSRESDLEHLLQEGGFSADLLARAKQMREVIVHRGLSKYGSADPSSKRPPFPSGSILVPGQVEDDRSVLSGGGDVRSNLELLRRVRNEAPDRYIIYKPHPDVEAGHRTGAIPDDDCLALADEIVRDDPISELISAVDEVHVNTSLAGFESLLRGKRVTTHGVPFYAGWGLTRDMGQVPDRRTAKRSLDELVAAALLIYPRYLDPVTGLPCPPEILIDRLSSGAGEQPQGLLVPLRRLQGRLKRTLSSFPVKLK